MKLEQILVTSLGAALALAACFPDITYRESDPGGGGSGNEAGTAGSGNDGGGSGGTGGTITSSGGGGGGAPCMLGEIGACGPGSKCSVVTPSTGEVDCVPAGDRPAWSRCFGDGDCAEGTWCDDFTEVCHPVCGSAGDCDGQEAQCIPAKVGATTVPGLKICTSDCHPLNGQPCNDDFGPTTCYYRVENAYWDCMRTLGFQDGSPCTTYGECARGLVCVDPDGCLPWCTNINGLCNGLGLCSPTNPVVTYHGVTLGLCI